jgi:hypothetical protein
MGDHNNIRLEFPGTTDLAYLLTTLVTQKKVLEHRMKESMLKNFFPSLLIVGQNKLGCLYLASLHSFRPGAYPIMEHLKGVRNGTVCFKKCKQLFAYQHLLLIRDIWWSKLC